MDEFKNALASKGVWGGIVAAIAGGAAILGYTITPADQQIVAGDLAQIVGMVSGVASMVGGLVAIWGRVVASKKIGKPS